MKLRETLQEQGRSQTWLARKIGYSRPYVNDVITGRYRGSRHFWRLVSQTLGVSFDYSEEQSHDGDYSSNGNTARTLNLRR